MEERKHIFNSTSKRLDNLVKTLYDETFDLMTDTTSNLKEFEQKEESLLKKLIFYAKQGMIFDIIKEKAYEYCINNINKVMDYDDNGPIIKDRKEDEGTFITYVFFELYKYLEFAACAYGVVQYRTEEKNANIVTSIVFDEATEDYNGDEKYSLESMDIFIYCLTPFVRKDKDGIFSSGIDFDFMSDAIFNKLSDGQLIKFDLHIDALCNIITAAQHYPEIFKDTLDINIKDLYSDHFIYTIFALRHKKDTRYHNDIKDATQRARSRYSPFEI